MSEQKHRMSGNKRAVEKEESSDSEMSFSEEEESSGGDMEVTNDINVEFEAFPPEENDFHGLKQLLLRTFVMLHIDVSDMSDLIISQKNIGSTIKIVDDDEDGVYGLVTLLNIDKYKERQCIREMKKQLLEKCKCQETKKKFKHFLENKRIGFLINERFINLPDQIAMPFHNSLYKECEDAIKQDHSLDFDYLMIIAKTMRPTTSVPAKEGESSAKNTTKGKKKKTNHAPALRSEDEVDYTNFEEEIYFKHCEMEFTYCVTQATGFAVAGSWDFVDQPMNTYRTVSLIPKQKWKDVLSEIKNSS